MSKKKKKKEAGASKKEKKVKKNIVEVAPEKVHLPLADLLGLEGIKKDKVNYLTGRLSDIGAYRDPGHAFNLVRELETELAPMIKDGSFDQAIRKDFGYAGINNLFSFRPQGSSFYNIFPNAFGIFSFLANNHWAVLDCRNILYREIYADSYVFEGGTKEEQDYARQVCKQLNMRRLRCEIADQLKLFGMCFFAPIRNGLKGLKNVKPLLPAYLRPIPTRDGQDIKEWQYQKGAWYVTYGKDQLLTAQFRRSQMNYGLGEAPLGAALLDIEADLQASMYNNVLFQKGGLLGIAVLLEKGSTHNRAGAGPSAYAQYLQATLNANNSGARSGFETVVFENTKSIEVLNDLSSLDGAFHKSSDKCSKQIAHCWGVPHEMIGIVTNANQQYHAASMMDYSAKQLDKTIQEVTAIGDDFVNTKIFPACGVSPNVTIKAVPRNNSVTRTATQSGVDLGSLVGVVTINEYRSAYLGLPPLGPEGDVALTKLTLDGGTKGGEGGAGAMPAQIIKPVKMPAANRDVIEQY